MIFTLPALLALFSLLAISSGVFFLAQRIKVPYTVLLVAVGTFILVPLAQLPAFSFIKSLTLTPELLFYIFLPVLIFESAYNINIRRMVENVRLVTFFAVISLLISAAFIATALFYILPFIGLHVPFVICLLFGALISATDPVAVLSLFKEVGAPRRLTLLFEGESIFNDGTAVALFLVVLEMALHGFHGSTSIIAGVGTFLMMVIGGIVFGTILGAIFAKAIGGARGNEFVQITLMLVLAHLTFILTDFISEHLVLFGYHIHLSAIIATTLASMVIGNYGRAKVPPHAEEFVEKFWTQFAFFANSLVFILIGLIFVSLSIRITDFFLPVIVAIILVAVGRALSVYPVVWLNNTFRIEEHIPNSWQHLLAWGSLRGALAVTMVLLIPDDLTVAGWNYLYSPKEFILALTLGCIFMTLFIKATTIEHLMRYLHISDFTDTEKLAFEEARGIVHLKALARLDRFKERGYISESIANVLKKEHMARLAASTAACTDRLLGDKSTLGTRVLHMYAIGVEKEMLKTLYTFGEVNEKVYRKVYEKLTLQYEMLDKGVPSNEDFHTIHDRKDVFEVMAQIIRKLFLPTHAHYSAEDMYMYYRTQSVLARALLRELTHMSRNEDEPFFGSVAFTTIRMLYERYLEGSTAKMEACVSSQEAASSREAERLARHSVLEVEEQALDELYKREMITPKIFIAIRDELEDQAERLSDIDDAR